MDFINVELAKIAQDLILKQEVRQGDYMQDGILYCRKCHKPRQHYVDVGAERIKLPIRCDCDEAKHQIDLAKEQAEKRQKYIEYLQTKSGLDEMYKDARFESALVTDGNREVVKACKRYADKFDEMYAIGQGLILWGDVGSGKTYLASCIANKLFEDKKKVSIFKFVDLLNSDNKFNTEEQVEEFEESHLWIIDDLGSERDTDFAIEKVYDIVDRRYRDGKPVIYTTNLNINQLKNQSDIRYRRIYDRILETCFPMEVKGSWRKKESSRRYDEMQKFLFGGEEK